MILHGYFRSSAAWRVRIALNLKGLAFQSAPHHLVRGEQRLPEYLRINPQGLVPSLVLDDDRILTQSLAIVEFLDETYPNPPLLPSDPFLRAKVRGAALAMVADIHPLQNLRTLQQLQGLGVANTAEWAGHFNRIGLAALQEMLSHEAGPFCFGPAPTLADVCLVPQLFGARRFKVDVAAFPRLLQAEKACLDLKAFVDAAPEKQLDNE